jgi:hypothetical protein
MAVPVSYAVAPRMEFTHDPHLMQIDVLTYGPLAAALVIVGVARWVRYELPHARDRFTFSRTLDGTVPP